MIDTYSNQITTRPYWPIFWAILFTLLLIYSWYQNITILIGISFFIWISFVLRVIQRFNVIARKMQIDNEKIILLDKNDNVILTSHLDDENLKIEFRNKRNLYVTIADQNDYLFGLGKNIEGFNRLVEQVPILKEKVVRSKKMTFGEIVDIVTNTIGIGS